MKNHILRIILFLQAMSGYAQEPLRCGSDVVLRRLYAQHPELRQKRETLDKERFKEHTGERTASVAYQIPVVFHILHQNGPENISDAQVKDGLRILNRDYGKRNPDTTQILPVFKNVADSAGIRFTLATIDPSGNCTNGIIHYYDPDTDWDDTSPTLYSHTWDPTKYMNVYIVRAITLSSGFGAAGYTYIPGTLADGDPADAIVVLDNYFGSIGTGSDFLSRVLTHEVGHWLGLYHVFGATNAAGVDCSGDDYISDTPVTPGYLSCPSAASPSQYQVCSPGLSENYQNYMDYSYCCKMFTHDQCQLMQSTLLSSISGRDNLSSNANLMATGVINPTVPCIPIADFKYDRTKTCPGAPVTFSDASWNGIPTAYSWNFPGGNPASSTASSPVVTYAIPGLYSVTYSSSNTAGSSAALTKSSLIKVSSGMSDYTAPWTEGFENLAQVNADWTFNSASGALNWQQSVEASYTGTYSAELNKTNNTRRNVTSMISPRIDLSAIAAPQLSFRLAAAEVSPNHVNSLKVYASVDCGVSWTTMYSKYGQALVTSANTGTYFIPNGPGEWRLEVVSLAAIAGAANASFKFEYTRDTIPVANNVFLDDILISTVTGIQEQMLWKGSLQLFPNPSAGDLTLSYSLFSKQPVKMILLDMLGRTLEVLLDTEQEAGEHRQALSLKTRVGDAYLLQVDVGQTRYVKKLLIER